MHLYDNSVSGNAYKVRLLLALLGLEYERTELSVVDRSNREDVLGSKNPALRMWGNSMCSPCSKTDSHCLRGVFVVLSPGAIVIRMPISRALQVLVCRASTSSPVIISQWTNIIILAPACARRFADSEVGHRRAWQRAVISAHRPTSRH